MLNPVTRYLGQLEGFLYGNVPNEVARTICAESEAHLRDLTDEFKSQGLTDLEAEQASVERFGSAGKLAMQIIVKKGAEEPRPWANGLKIASFAVGAAILAYAAFYLSNAPKATSLMVSIAILCGILFVGACSVTRKSHFVWLICITLLVSGWVGFRRSQEAAAVYEFAASSPGHRLPPIELGWPSLSGVSQYSILGLLHASSEFQLDGTPTMQRINSMYGNQVFAPGASIKVQSISAEVPGSFVVKSSDNKSTLYYGPADIATFQKAYRRAYVNPLSFDGQLGAAFKFPLGKLMSYQQAQSQWKQKLPGYLKVMNNDFYLKQPDVSTLKTPVQVFSQAFTAMAVMLLPFVGLECLIVMGINPKRAREHAIRQMVV